MKKTYIASKFVESSKTYINQEAQKKIANLYKN